MVVHRRAARDHPGGVIVSCSQAEDLVGEIARLWPVDGYGTTLDLALMEGFASMDAGRPLWAATGSESRPWRARTDDWLGAAFCRSGGLRPGTHAGGGRRLPMAERPEFRRPDSAQPPRGSAMDYPNEEWQRKGATLSDKTAREEFGLTQDEIYDAIDAGTLHYRQAAIPANPLLKLPPPQAQALARTSHGDRYVNERQDKAELARVNRAITRLPPELAPLEARRPKLSSDLGE